MARILVVDDELDVVRMVARTLEGRGHTVEVARDGEAALTLIARQAPELLVIDANLPRVDGAEVCRRLRADPATRALPIVMMCSAYVSLTDAQEPGEDRERHRGRVGHGHGRGLSRRSTLRIRVSRTNGFMTSSSAPCSAWASVRLT